MKAHSFDWGRFGIALLLIGITVAIFYADKVDDFGISWIFYLIMILVDLLLLYRAIWAKDYFCADCGYYFGHHSDSCRRCGCNRYTRYDKGVGHTIRDGGKNY